MKIFVPLVSESKLGQGDKDVSKPSSVNTKQFTTTDVLLWRVIPMCGSHMLPNVF